MIHFVVPRDTAFGIQDYLGLWGVPLAGRIQILHYEDLPRRTSLPAGAYILSALDQLEPEGRRLVGETHEQLTGAGQGVCVLNHPLQSLRRYDLLEELYRLGLNRHRAARALGPHAGLRFPVFLREADRHTSALTALIHSPGELESELGRALVRGLRLEELLVVEFYDTADPEGWYRKYAAFIVGEEIIPRSLNHGRSWALKHSGTDFTRSMLDEERAYVLENPHEAQLRRIFAAGRIEYGRIDYAVRDGVVETWEINLNPTIGRGLRQSSGKIPEAIQPFREEAKKHFYSRFQAALEAIDPPGGPAPLIPIRYRPETLEALTRVARGRHPTRRFETIKILFRPLRPLLQPILRAVSPLLARLAHRKRESNHP
jgi:hypothetical protein